LTVLSSTLVYAETFSVDVEGTSFDVDYTTTGMIVTGVEVDLESISLILSVESTSIGTLDVILDRSFFDSLSDENGVFVDDDFFILADDDSTNFTEVETTVQSRTLSIKVPSGTSDIEIIGTVFGATVSEPTMLESVDDTPNPTPVDDTPNPTPVDDTPNPTPVDDTPNPTPVDDTPKTQCGPGTVLKNNACVLDERCGPGTILVNGACIVEESTSKSITLSKAMGKELITGVIAAIVIAGIVGIILGVIAKASKKNN
jgi:hypothetical protein